MSSFNGFSAAARLYAENFDVVELMWKAFVDGINEFFDHLLGEVQRRVGDRQVQVKPPSGDSFRYWWFVPLPDAGRDNPCCYCRDEISPNYRSWRTLYRRRRAKKDITDEIKTRIQALRDDPEIKPYVVGASQDTWDLLALKLPYPDGNPVEVVAPVLAALLLKVTTEAEKA